MRLEECQKPAALAPVNIWISGGNVEAINYTFKVGKSKQISFIKSFFSEERKIFVMDRPHHRRPSFPLL